MSMCVWNVFLNFIWIDVYQKWANVSLGKQPCLITVHRCAVDYLSRTSRTIFLLLTRFKNTTDETATLLCVLILSFIRKYCSTMYYFAQLFVVCICICLCLSNDFQNYSEWTMCGFLYECRLTQMLHKNLICIRLGQRGREAWNK